MLFNPTEKGQGLIEYALMLVLIAMVVIVVIRILGETVIGMYNQISNGFK